MIRKYLGGPWKKTEIEWKVKLPPDQLYRTEEGSLVVWRTYRAVEILHTDSRLIVEKVFCPPPLPNPNWRAALEVEITPQGWTSASLVLSRWDPGREEEREEGTIIFFSAEGLEKWELTEVSGSNVLTPGGSLPSEIAQGALIEIREIASQYQQEIK